MTRARNHTSAGPFDDLAISLADDAQRVAPGEYAARVIACRRQWRFGRDMLVFQFHLLTRGPCFGAIVQGYCNLDLDGHIRAIPTRSKLGRWVKILREFDPSISTGRVHLRVFAQYEFVVRVELTQHDCNRRPLAANLRYPKIQEIVRVAGRRKNTKKQKEKRPISSHSIPSHLCKVNPIDMKEET